MKETPLPLNSTGDLRPWEHFGLGFSGFVQYAHPTGVFCLVALLWGDLELKSPQIHVGNITTPGTRKHIHGIK